MPQAVCIVSGTMQTLRHSARTTSWRRTRTSIEQLLKKWADISKCLFWKGDTLNSFSLAIASRYNCHEIVLCSLGILSVLCKAKAQIIEDVAALAFEHFSCTRTCCRKFKDIPGFFEILWIQRYAGSSCLASWFVMIRYDSSRLVVFWMRLAKPCALQGSLAPMGCPWVRAQS
jgi:hypothetical protein